MNTQYNLSNLEVDFKQYLLAVNQKMRKNTNNKDEHEKTLNIGLNPVTIKNYLSDFRHFYGWINLDSHGLTTDFHGSNQRKSASLSAGIDFLQLITPTVIHNYKSYLTNDRIPPKTINRRLSTLRKFGSFCISQGWMKENMFKKVSNVTTLSLHEMERRSYNPEIRSRDNPVNKERPIGNEIATPSRRKTSGLTRNDILDQYRQYLVKQNLGRQNINNLIVDVEEFHQLTQNNL